MRCGILFLFIFYNVLKRERETGGGWEVGVIRHIIRFVGVYKYDPNIYEVQKNPVY